MSTQTAVTEICNTPFHIVHPPVTCGYILHSGPSASLTPLLFEIQMTFFKIFPLNMKFNEYALFCSVFVFVFITRLREY